MNSLKSLEKYFDSYLPLEYQDNVLPPMLTQKRTQTLSALMIQFFSSIAGFSFYFLRRVSNKIFQ